MADRLSVTIIATGMGLNGSRTKMPDAVLVKETRPAFNMKEEKAFHPEFNNVQAQVQEDAEESDWPAMTNAPDPYENTTPELTTSDNFGFSPVISKNDWNIPACQRRSCRHKVVPEQVSRPLVGKTDVRKEVSSFMRTKRKNRRLFREPTLRMAC